MRRLSRLIGFGYLLLCFAMLAATALRGPVGYAPFPFPIGPAQDPVVVTIWYGTEKKEWLEESVRRFTATDPRVGNRPIEIVLRGLGSREQAERVARQEWGADGAPTVISPASSMWVEVLRTEWQARNPGAPPVIAEGAGAPQPLVLTPIVVVAWEERARALWPNGSESFWQDIHDALVNENGWVGVVEARRELLSDAEYQELAAKARDWGLPKFGHTRPTTSNSGAQALMLLAYGYHDKVRGLTAADVTSAPFRTWLREIESGVIEFGDSSGTFMTNMVQFGPSKYDFVVTYENLALENIAAARGRWNQDIKIYYPPATMFSDHPYALLSAPWVSTEQTEAALLFRDFLLSRPIQELALNGVEPARPFGFRPADPNVSVVTSEPSNPFNAFQQYGVRVDIPQVAETPNGTVVGELLEVWRREVNR
jgi:ABC-type Fe3+ transport system substrate-binding protein